MPSLESVPGSIHLVLAIEMMSLQALLSITRMAIIACIAVPLASFSEEKAATSREEQRTRFLGHAEFRPNSYLEGKDYAALWAYPRPISDEELHIWHAAASEFQDHSDLQCAHAMWGLTDVCTVIVQSNLVFGRTRLECRFRRFAAAI